MVGWRDSNPPPLDPQHFGFVSARAVQCRDLRFRTLARPWSAVESAQYRLLREHSENISLCALTALDLRQRVSPSGARLTPVEEFVEVPGHAPTLALISQ